MSLRITCSESSFHPIDSIAGRLFTNVRKTTQRGKKLIGPMIEERQRYLSEYGNEWADKPVGQFRLQTSQF